MANKPTPSAKLLQWRLECLAHSFVELLASVLPGAWVFHAGEAFAGLMWYIAPKRRKVVIRNMRIAYADQKDMGEIMRMAKASFRRSGGNMISGAHTARLSPSRLNEVLEIENVELMQQSMDRGRGVVLLLSHMGNWELLSRLIHFFPKGAKAGAMYRPLNNVFMDERVCARRQADGTRMFSKRDPFHQITGFLREGGIVGVLVDQRVGVNGDLVQFFGRLTRASPLPSLLARRSKSDVLALSMVTEGPGKWTARFLPVDSPPTTKHCVSALEKAMRQGPLDVFWLQERWRVRLGPGRLLPQMMEDGQSVPGKNHRALIWIVDQEAPSDMAERWRHSDVNYELALEADKPLLEWLPEEVKVHRLEAVFGTASIARSISDIDAAQALPLDYVLTFNDDQDLREACKLECIPVYSHAMRIGGKKKAKRRRSD